MSTISKNDFLLLRLFNAVTKCGHVPHYDMFIDNYIGSLALHSEGAPDWFGGQRLNFIEGCRSDNIRIMREYGCDIECCPRDEESRVLLVSEHSQPRLTAPHF